MSLVGVNVVLSFYLGYTFGYVAVPIGLVTGYFVSKWALNNNERDYMAEVSERLNDDR